MIRNRSAPRPAASVAFVRDSPHGIEIYLTRRPAHFRYFPGAFVFPGGRAEDSDQDLKATACREVTEEIGVHIDPEQLFLLRETHTAAHAGPVYHLFIFACRVEGEFATALNADEIEEEAWVSAKHALKSIDLPYQIMVAVYSISRFDSCEILMDALSRGSMNEDYLL
jgi:8-oxo-dGTP pyrophosphatase MutT (NUDIX family)